MKKIIFAILSFFLFQQIQTSDNKILLKIAYWGDDPYGLETLLASPATDINYQSQHYLDEFKLPECAVTRSTALHIAIISIAIAYTGNQVDESKSANRLNMITTLLSHPEINVNIQDADGNTPLLQAARCYYIGSVRFEIIRLLLAKGAIVDIKNNEGKSFLDYAAADPEIKKVYDEFEAKIKENSNPRVQEIMESIQEMPKDVANLIGQYVGQQVQQ